MFFNSNEKENQKCKENNTYTNFSSSAKRNCKCAHLDNVINLSNNLHVQLITLTCTLLYECSVISVAFSTDKDNLECSLYQWCILNLSYSVYLIDDSIPKINLRLKKIRKLPYCLLCTSIIKTILFNFLTLVKAFLN